MMLYIGDYVKLMGTNRFYKIVETNSWAQVKLSDGIWHIVDSRSFDSHVSESQYDSMCEREFIESNG